MKLERQQRTDERIGLHDEGQFTIKTSPELFALLSDGLYTDKVLAVVRELSCNAWDAHREVGAQDKPFLIHLPNDLEPYFTIRDYGTGLAHKDVLELYTTYGESTKSNSNDFIGALGVGSKSPFAYGDSFTVTSYFDGERRSYTAFLSGEGIPSIAMMGEAVDTDQPNGFEISLPVSTRDFSEFATKATQVLRRFDPIPEVHGGQNRFTLDPVGFSIEGDGWRLRKHDPYMGYNAHNRAFAIQGNIAYPIVSNSVQDASNVQDKIFDLAIDIDFDIGELDIAASREGLGYKPRTVQNLKDKADKIFAEIEKKLNDEIKDCKTMWDAQIHRNNTESTLSRLAISPKWKGQEVKSRIHWTMSEYPGLRFHTPAIDYQSNLRKNPANSSLYLTPSPNTEFWVEDVGTAFWPRFKAYMTDHTDKDVVMIQLSADSTNAENSLKEFKKLTKGSTWKKLSSLPKPAPKKTAKNQTDFFTRAYSIIHPARDRDHWDASAVDIEDGGIWVEIKNFRTIDRDGEVFKREENSRGRATASTEGRDLNTFIRSLINLGALKDGVEIYGVKSCVSKKLKASDGWVNLFDLAKKKVPEIVKKEKLNELISARTEIADQIEVPDWFLNTGSSNFPDVKMPEFKAFVKRFEEVQLQSKKKKIDTNEVQTLLSVLGIDLKNQTGSLDSLWKKIEEKAPLLPHLNFGYRPNLTTTRLKALTDYLNSI